MTRLRTVGAGTLLGALVLVGLPVGAWAQPVTDYQMPFPCGQEWKGTTRSGHSPSPRSIDWNRADDDGDPVVASAPGVVTTAEASSTKGYGHHVVLDHGDGESTVYAHLDEVHVVEGQHVDQASQLGTVGSTGNSTGPHLHYEQRLDRKDVEAWFDGAAFVYGSTQRSANCVDVPMAANMIGTPAAELVVYRRAKRSQFLVQRAGKAPIGHPALDPIRPEPPVHQRNEHRDQREQDEQLDQDQPEGLYRMNHRAAPSVDA